jgi:hypothetical protein
MSLNLHANVDLALFSLLLENFYLAVQSLSAGKNNIGKQSCNSENQQDYPSIFIHDPKVDY